MEASGGECGRPSLDPKGAGAERWPGAGRSFAAAAVCRGRPVENAGFKARRAL